MGKKGKELSRNEAIKKLAHESQTAHANASPLSTLHQVHEDSTDPNRFIGDTMFWKYFDDINPDHIYHTSSVEFRNLKIMFFETCFYIFLVLMCTLFVYEIQSNDVFASRREQLEYWGGCDKAGSCKIREVSDIVSFWRWTRESFIPAAFTQHPNPPKVANIETLFDKAPEFTVTWSPRFVGPTMTNVVLGAVRMRQVRVQDGLGCQVSKLYSHTFPECFGAFSTPDQSMLNFAKRLCPTYLRHAFNWTAEAETMQIPLSGSIASYPGDGFMVDLPVNNSESVIMMNDLQEWRWIDRATRAVIIELTTLNTNVNIIVNTRIVFEFGAAGSVLSTVDSYAAQVLFFTPSTKPGAPLSVFMFQLFLFMLFLGYTGWLSWLIWRTCANYLGEPFFHWVKVTPKWEIFCHVVRTMKYFCSYGWNLVDTSIVIMFYIYMGLRMDTYAAVSAEPNLTPDVIGHPEKFMPFARVMVPLINSNFVLSVMAFTIWVKLFKYLCLSSYFRFLVRVLERCAKRLVIFSMMLIVIFFGFAVAFYIMYGTTDETFSTLLGSFLVLFFMLLGGSDVNVRWFGPKFELKPWIFLAYIVLVYVVLLNVFMSIVLDVYQSVSHLRAGMMNSSKRNPMVVFILTFYNYLKGISLVKEDANVSQEDMGIKVELLPGIVRRKWIEKKKAMQKVADASLAGLEVFQGERQLLAEYEASQRSNWGLPTLRQEIVARTVGLKPAAMYEIPDYLLQQDISKSQLQRLLDEDESLPILLGTSKAVDVIRRFRLGREGEFVASEPPVTVLQDAVLGKIESLENSGIDAEFKDVPQVKVMTDEVIESLGEIRNDFRHELIGVIEATAQLSEHFVELTKALELVRSNNEQVLEVCLGEGDSWDAYASEDPASVSGGERSRAGTARSARTESDMRNTQFQDRIRKGNER